MFYNLLRPYIKSSLKRTYKRGDIIYHEGSTPQSLYLVERGLVGLFHISENGKETFLRVFGKDCIFGHRSYFAETPYHATSMAIKQTDVAVISGQQCSDICQNNPKLLLKMTQLLAINLEEAELRLAGLQDKSATTKIIESMVYLKNRYPDQVWTRKEIAEYAASTLETVARVMSKLNEAKLIEKKGRDFNIPNSQELLDFFSD
jgi:CRP-like cAMP-binding protein